MTDVHTTSNGFNSDQEVLHKEKLHDHKPTESFEHSVFIRNLQGLNLWLPAEPNRNLFLKSRTPFCCSAQGGAWQLSLLNNRPGSKAGAQISRVRQDQPFQYSQLRLQLYKFNLFSIIFHFSEFTGLWKDGLLVSL